MLIEPRIEDLLARMDTKYSLVVLAARRARQINDYASSLHRPDVLRGVPPLVKSESNKPLTIALEEIAAEKVTWKRVSESIK